MNSNTSPLRDESQLSDDRLAELADGAHQEALSFGLDNTLFLRYFKTIRAEAEVRSLRSQAQAEHVGETNFEIWYSENPQTPYTKDSVRRAYWAGYLERAAPPLSQPIASDVVAAPDALSPLLRAQLRHLVDLTTNHVTESEMVLATETIDRLIDEAMKDQPTVGPDVLSRQSPVEADTQPAPTSSYRALVLAIIDLGNQAYVDGQQGNAPWNEKWNALQTEIEMVVAASPSDTSPNNGCGCRGGECESKPVGCQMVAEVNNPGGPHQ